MAAGVSARPSSPTSAGQFPLDTLLSRLREIAAGFGNVAFASSLGAEDMVVTDAILTGGLPITIFTLDTGRLPRETLDLLERMLDRYSHEIEVYKPDADEVAGYVSAHGANAFYESVDLRKSCCYIRKVKPLARALAGRYASQAPLAVAAIKRAVNRGLDRPLAEGLAVERDEFVALFASEDAGEGIAAFREKRDARWTGG